MVFFRFVSDISFSSIDNNRNDVQSKCVPKHIVPFFKIHKNFDVSDSSI
jgi:hypothetical protein